MKKIFTFCLAGALALASTSCKDDKNDGFPPSGTIAVNGRTEPVKSAFYTEEPADHEAEAGLELGLFRDAFTTIPHEEPEFYVGIEISESLYGKTIDLTQPVTKSGTLEPYLGIIAAANGPSIDIDNSWGSIDISVGEEDTSLTVTSGTLKVTKEGDKFTVNLSVKLSDGKTISANWSGTAVKVATY